jgi:PAS domain S-box-containing protein
VEVYTSPIEMPGEKLLFAIVHDVTERRQMEAALQESEALYKAVVNNSQNLILITVDNVVEFTNDAASQFLEIGQEQLTGKTIDEALIHYLVRLEGNSLAEMINESVEQNRSIEVQFQDHSGNSYFLIRSNPIQYKGKDAILSTFTDITENKNIEKYVLKKVIETEENDRRQFAADLHDDLGPILSTIKLRLDLMETMNPSEELKENISISNELTGLVVEKIRTISHNITPHLIETLGLDAGVRDLCKKIKELNKIDITLESNIESRRFPQLVELHYYRIISELVNNSLKHSQASEIKINLSGKEDKLELIYFDNGIGYNYSEGLQKSGGIGLRNIINRVTLINGSINFSTLEGKTVVRIQKKLEPVLISN